VRAGPFLSVKFRIPLTEVVGERRARTTKRLPALVGVERLRGRYLQRIQTMGLERFTPYVAPLPWRDLSVLCKRESALMATRTTLSLVGLLSEANRNSCFRC